mmetsp:Transcript_13037/g.24920  ORF Transcript_13037/g.24920 Transcript_13037/m.24920 type:complete len:262 (+) Transcript_13037:1109-1894(+)
MSSEYRLRSELSSLVVRSSVALSAMCRSRHVAASSAADDVDLRMFSTSISRSATILLEVRAMVSRSLIAELSDSALASAFALASTSAVLRPCSLKTSFSSPALRSLYKLSSDFASASADWACASLSCISLCCASRRCACDARLLASTLPASSSALHTLAACSASRRQRRSSCRSFSAWALSTCATSKLACIRAASTAFSRRASWAVAVEVAARSALSCSASASRRASSAAFTAAARSSLMVSLATRSSPSFLWVLSSCAVS